MKTNDRHVICIILQVMGSFITKEQPRPMTEVSNELYEVLDQYLSEEAMASNLTVNEQREPSISLEILTDGFYELIGKKLRPPRLPRGLHIVEPTAWANIDLVEPLKFMYTYGAANERDGTQVEKSLQEGLTLGEAVRRVLMEPPKNEVNRPRK
jgi:hypothetical protein